MSAWLSTLCSPGIFSGGLLTGLFLAGAAGSTMHCVPMCGGFVLGQMADRMARLPAERLCEWRRIGGGALPGYHLGRLTTYAGLGAAGGALLQHMPGFGPTSSVLLVLAALLFAAQAARRLFPVARRNVPAMDRAPAAWSVAIGWLAGRAGASGYPLGIALGFLPCGFLYAALASATAAGSPLLGATAMLAFGLGTVPSLMIVGIAGHAAGRRWQRGIAAAAPAVMLLNAALLVTLALRALALS
jgi:sulfite exporter TauE/SafE